MLSYLQAYSSTLSKDSVNDIITNLSETLHNLLEHGLLSKFVATVVLIAAVGIARWLGARIVRRFEHATAQTRRRWLVQIKNVALILLVVGLIGIWAEALRVVAYSLFAIAVATVIATKELIQCVTGSFLKSSSRSFKLGDRIEIGTIRGDVIDQNALTTTLLEVASDNLSQQPTGRAITIPNSLLLDKPIVNESFTHEFVLHIFKVPVKLDENWPAAEADLLTSAKAECKSYLEEARKHFAGLSKREGLVALAVDPRVSVRIVKPEEMELVVRIAVPSRKKSRIEQAILRGYLKAAFERRMAEKAEKDSTLEKVKEES